jgi:hypothetical protein
MSGCRPIDAKGWASEDGTSRRAIHALLPVYLMLVAYAVENILKAIIIVQNREHLASELAATQRLPKRMRSHDLVMLAQIAGTDLLTHRETELLLHRMSRSAVWYGRYPVPLSPEDFKPRKSDSGELQFLNRLTSTDVAEVKGVLRKLRLRYARCKAK